MNQCPQYVKGAERNGCWANVWDKTPNRFRSPGERRLKPPCESGTKWHQGRLPRFLAFGAKHPNAAHRGHPARATHLRCGLVALHTGTIPQRRTRYVGLDAAVLRALAESGFVKEPMPSIVTSTVQPSLIDPTPREVPQAITSPGNRVMS